MPLVKGGNIVNDAYLHMADDPELPGDGAILISAARFLEDPEGLLRRPGKLGVIWPNNRDVDDLLPCLDRLAVVALVFPTFRDGRAYTQARLLRERHGYRGELRATGQVLRDQFVFMLRAGFDAFEVKEAERRRGVCRHRQALLGVLPADRRRPHHGAAPADAVASFGKRRPVNGLARPWAGRPAPPDLRPKTLLRSPFSHGWYATTCPMRGKSRIMRAAVAIIGLLALGGCAAEAPIEQPTMYLNMANAGAKLDPVAAASMISLYRQNNGLGAVAVDPELMKLAEQQSQAMASRNKLDHDVKAPLTQRLNASGYPTTAGGGKCVRRISHPGRGLFGLARLAPAPGKYAEKGCHKIRHRGELCSEYQIQGVLGAYSRIIGAAITSP